MVIPAAILQAIPDRIPSGICPRFPTEKIYPEISPGVSYGILPENLLDIFPGLLAELIPRVLGGIST